MQRWTGNGCLIEQGRSEVSAGFKWRVWGLAQGCRQIHDWEVGRRVWEGGKAREVGSNFMTTIFVFFFSFLFYVYFFGILVSISLFFTNSMRTQRRLRVMDG